MKILFEDNEIIVAIKQPNQNSEYTDQKNGFPDLLAAHTKGYIGVVHRLDLGVGGVMVYAKTPSAARILSEQMQNRTVKKEYLAVIRGKIIPESAELRDLLFFDRRMGKSFVVDRQRTGVKEAILTYRTLASSESPTVLSLLSVSLQTGRTHQIRVQFASRGYPLVNDRKYGSDGHGQIRLYCHRLTFLHPVSRKELCFSDLPTGEEWELFRNGPDSSFTKIR